jgi:hypothetical protein
MRVDRPHTDFGKYSSDTSCCMFGREFHFSELSYGALIIWRPISLMELQFVVTHTIRQTDIPALLNIWVKNTFLT